nr:uncharacterized protein LOC109619056 isoform X3 [Crassostrea gigas]
MHRTQLHVPSAPSSRFLGPLPSGDSLFVLVDYYSRYKVIEIMKSTTGEKTVSCLKKIFSVSGLPLSITTDNGPQFVSDVFSNFMHENQIQYKRTTPLWPQANGEVERQNRSLMKRIRIAQSEKKNWKEELETSLLMYRSVPHSVTGISPAELMFGRKIRTKIPQVRDFHIDDFEVRDRDSELKEKGREYSNAKRGSTDSDISPGDKVLVKQTQNRDKMTPTFRPEPMTVKAKYGNSLTLDADGVEYKRNITHVKKFLEKHNDPQKVKQNDVESKAITDDDEKIEMRPSDTEKPGIVEPEHEAKKKNIPVSCRPTDPIF